MPIHVFSPFEEPQAPVPANAIIDTGCTLGLVVPKSIGKILDLPDVEKDTLPTDAYGRPIEGYYTSAWISDNGEHDEHMVETPVFVAAEEIPDVLIGCYLLGQWDAELHIRSRVRRFPRLNPRFNPADFDFKGHIITAFSRPYPHREED